MFVDMVIVYGGPAYINNLWLVPKYLLRRKYIQYTIAFFVLLSFTAIASFYSTRLLNSLYPGMNFMGKKEMSIFYHAFPCLWTFIILGFGKFVGDSIRNQIQLEDLQKQRLESELAALKSQINPHFLFNALNTIYGMARRTDTATADAVLKLSDILRHNLYECDEPEITIEKELFMLRQYVEFTQLRLRQKEAMRLNIEANTNGQKIAPLLLIPFVENAIKHGLGGQAYNSWVNIDLQLIDTRLLFTCINNYNSKPKHTESPSNSGIGLKNVKRRLELLYPNKHELDIHEHNNTYTVTLTIQLQ